MVSSVRVLIADAHEPARRALAETIEDEGFAVCGEVSDAESAVERAVSERPTLCMVDADLPGSGIGAARLITSRVPDTRVIVLTAAKESGELLDALRSGASGYLLKKADPSSYSRALRAVLDGEAAIPRELTEPLVAELRHSQHRWITVDGRATRLSQREWEVLELLRTGRSTAQIAERMFVAPVTIRSHVSSLFRKLGVSSRDEILERAFGAAS